MQLIHAAPVAWKDCLAHGEINSFNLPIQNQNLIKKNSPTFGLEKLASKEMKH